MTISSILNPILGTLAFAAPLGSQAGTPSNPFPSPDTSLSCNSDAYRALDAWIGEWRATDVATGTDAGRAQISRELGGCAILERWDGLGGDGKPYDGFGVHRFDANSGKWTQNWFGDQADAMVMLGTAKDGGVQYERQFERDGAEILSHQYIMPLPEGRFSNRGERSTDGGRTWVKTFDLVYDRMVTTR